MNAWATLVAPHALAVFPLGVNRAAPIARARRRTGLRISARAEARRAGQQYAHLRTHGRERPRRAVANPKTHAHLAFGQANFGSEGNLVRERPLGGERAVVSPDPVAIDDRHVLLVPDGRDVGVSELNDLAVREDRLGHIDHDVARVLPRQEDRSFGASHGRHRAFEKAGPGMAATWVRREFEPANRGGGGGFVQASYSRCFGGGETMIAHVMTPVSEILARGLHLGRQGELAILGRAIARFQQRIGRRRSFEVRPDVAERQRGEALLLQMFHVAPERVGRRVDPGMRDVRHAVELQHDDPAFARLGYYFHEVLEGPAGIGVTGGGNQKRMMALRIVHRSHHHLAVLHFRGATAPRQRNAAFAQHRDRLGAERIAAPGKARGLGYFDAVEFVIHQGHFGFEPRR